MATCIQLHSSDSNFTSVAWWNQTSGTDITLQLLLLLVVWFYMWYTGNELSSESHTVPGVGRRKGTSCYPTRGANSLDHKMQKEKKKAEAIWWHCRPWPGPQCKRSFSLRLMSCRWTCSALIVRWLPPLSPFLPPVLCSSLYAAGRMSTWSCQTWTRVQERAWRGRGGKKIGFFSVISRSGTVSCTSVRASLQICARVGTTSDSLPLHSLKETFTSWFHFFLSEMWHL